MKYSIIKSDRPLRALRLDYRANGMQVFKAVDKVIFNSDLLHIVKIVLITVFTEKLIHTV